MVLDNCKILVSNVNDSVSVVSVANRCSLPVSRRKWEESLIMVLGLAGMGEDMANPLLLVNEIDNTARNGNIIPHIFSMRSDAIHR